MREGLRATLAVSAGFCCALGEMLRSCAARLRMLGALRRDERWPARNLGPALRWFSSEKDFCLSNPSWSEDLRHLFHQFMKKCEDGSWTHISEKDMLDLQKKASELSFQNFEPMKRKQFPSMLTRNFQEGLGFEYSIFYNKDERRIVCLFQGGPLLQGYPGFVHGGATVTMVDYSFGMLSIKTVGFSMTAYINITYKRPIPIGLVVVINSQVDKTEGRKVFLSSSVHSADEKTLYSEVTGLFVQLNLEKSET